MTRTGFPYKRQAVVSAALALALAPTAFAPVAFAKTIEAPLGVSDDITRLHVNKLDERTHEAVSGARMQIIVRDTGEVVDEWVTDGTTHKFEKGLDVNVVYVLREVEAPAGYQAIADVEFYANETEGTGLTLLSNSGSVELTDAYKLALYEPHDANVVIEERVEYTNTIVKTGDNTPVVVIALLACAGAGGVVVALVARRKSNK